MRYRNFPSEHDLIPSAKNLALSNLLRATVCALLLIANPINLWADDTELRSSADRNEVRIADPFQVEIQILAPVGTQVSFPSIENALGPFEILSVKEGFDIPVSSNQRSWTQTLSLETLDTGRLEIPSVEVTIAEPDQPEQFRRTEPIAVNVIGVVEPSSDLTQFKGVADMYDVELPKPTSYRWIWIGSGIAAAGLFAGSLMLLTTRRKKAVSPLAWALARLSETGDLSRAETILRQYIEERFGLAASSLPSDKILAHLQQLNVRDSALQGLKEMMHQAEKMKFGGLEFSDTEEARLVNLASKLAEQLDKNGEDNA